MNRMHRIIWNDARQAYVVAHEHAASHGKPASSVKRAASALAAFLIAQAAHAAPLPNQLPTGGQVVAGQAAIAQSGNAMTVNQGSNRAVINWNTFNIGSGAQVNFVQSSASAVALNRVTGSDPSSIYGALHANGQVYLVNPNGVLFARGAQVNVGGLVASTMSIANSEFMAGKNAFARNGSIGGVVNAGTIDAKYVALLGPQVQNQGVIVAHEVAMAAGDAVTLDITGNDLVDVQVQKSTINTLVQNGGAIQADAGTVILTAQSASQLLGQVINSGDIEANGIAGNGGTVKLLASGAVDSSGNISANSGTIGAGGSILVTGSKVTVGSGSKLVASGSSGGGEILIGGDYQGKNTAIQNAVSTTVEQGATIRADAVERGNGGKLVVWSDGQTAYQGTASARGGAFGGDGGNAEVSGKQRLIYQGTVDLRAPIGKTGNLLLDPTDVTITDAGAPTGSIAVTGNTSIIQTTDLANALALANVTISTTSGGGGNGDIVVAQGTGAYTFFLTTHDLTLVADRDIIVNESLNLTDPIVQPSLALIAGRNLTINNLSGTTAVTTTKNFLLVADAAQNGTGPGAMTLASGLSLGGSGVNRLFAPNPGAMQGLNSGSFSFVDPTPNVVTGKWVGDTGTSATGIYYKSATSTTGGGTTSATSTTGGTTSGTTSDGVINLAAIESASRISDLLATRDFNTWLNFLGLYDQRFSDLVDNALSAQDGLKSMQNDGSEFSQFEGSIFASQLQDAFGKLEKYLPDYDIHYWGRVDQVSRINDPEMNAWLYNMQFLERWVIQHGRDDNTLASIAQLKKKIDAKLSSYSRNGNR